MVEPSSLDGDACAVVAMDQRAGGKKRNAPEKSFRKAPGAPKRFKSPYILFSIHRMDKHRQQLGARTNVTSISKLVSDEWKALSENERREWSERARFDKERYNAERSLYTGPWVIPSKRSRKDPSAPKRPMSAFLFYSQQKRGELKNLHPGLKNTDLSRLLGELWKAAAEDERMPFIEREKKERSVYNRDIAEWRKQKDEEEKAVREHRQLVAEEWIKSGYHTNGTGVGAQVYAPMNLIPNCNYVQHQRLLLPHVPTHHSTATRFLSVPPPPLTYFQPIVNPMLPQPQGTSLPTATAIIPPSNDPQATYNTGTDDLSDPQSGFIESPNVIRTDQIVMAPHSSMSVDGTFVGHMLFQIVSMLGGLSP